MLTLVMLRKRRIGICEINGERLKGGVMYKYSCQADLHTILFTIPFVSHRSVITPKGYKI